MTGQLLDAVRSPPELASRIQEATSVAGLLFTLEELFGHTHVIEGDLSIFDGAGAKKELQRIASKYAKSQLKGRKVTNLHTGMEVTVTTRGSAMP